MHHCNSSLTRPLSWGLKVDGTWPPRAIRLAYTSPTSLLSSSMLGRGSVPVATCCSSEPMATAGRAGEPAAEAGLRGEPAAEAGLAGEPAVEAALLEAALPAGDPAEAGWPAVRRGEAPACAGLASAGASGAVAGCREAREIMSARSCPISLRRLCTSALVSPRLRPMPLVRVRVRVRVNRGRKGEHGAVF